MTKIFYKKEITWAFLILILPLLPYLHILFKESQFDLWTISIYKNSAYNRFELYYLIYATLGWVSLGALFFLWLRTAAEFLKISILVLLIWCLNKTFVAAFGIIGDGKILLNAITGAIFVLLYINHRYTFIPKTKTPIENSFFKRLASYVLISMPFAAHLWLLLPAEETVIDFYFFEIGPERGFSNPIDFIYILSKKSCLFVCFLLWFLLEKNWWKYALLSPIVLLANQIYNTFNPHQKVLDEFELSQSGPLLATLAIFLILLSKAVENQHRIKAFFEVIYDRVEKKVAKRFEHRQNYIEEKRNKLNQSFEELAELEKLKTELEQELQKP